MPHSNPAICGLYNLEFATAFKGQAPQSHKGVGAGRRYQAIIQINTSKDGWSGMVLLKLQSESVLVYIRELILMNHPEGRWHMLSPFLLMVNRCTGQKLGSSTRQLLRMKMNAGKNKKYVRSVNSPKIKCPWQLIRLTDLCRLIGKLSYSYLGILYFLRKLKCSEYKEIEYSSSHHSKRTVTCHICFKSFFLSFFFF